MMLQLPKKYPLVDEQLSNGFHAVRRSDRYWARLSTYLTIEQMRAVKGRRGLIHLRGMTGSVRLTWVRRLHRCGAFHGVLLDLDHSFDILVVDDNIEVLRDTSITLLFHCKVIFTLLVMSMNTNCDRAEEVGLHILESVDNVPYTEVTTKRADQLKNMSHLDNAVSVEKKSLNTDCNVLFNRLLLIAERSSDVEQCFMYEHSHTPAALFNDSFMRRVDKSKLMHELVTGTGISSPPGKETVFVIDG